MPSNTIVWSLVSGNISGKTNISQENLNIQSIGAEHLYGLGITLPKEWFLLTIEFLPVED